MDVLPLLRRIEVALDEMRRTQFDAFIRVEEDGAKYNLGASGRSSTNTAALSALVGSRPGFVSDGLTEKVKGWREKLLSEAEAQTLRLGDIKSEGREAAYKLGQLQPAVNDPEIGKKLCTWLSSSIKGWSLRLSPAPSLFLVHLVEPPISGDLAQEVFALSDYVIARQVAAAASGDWSDFNAIDLALALGLVKSSAISPSLLASAIKILNDFSEREGIWKNHPSSTISGSSAGCSSLFACVRLLRRSDHAIVSRLEPALISHLTWAFGSTIDGCWRGSDLPGRNSEPETWFNCLCVEFFYAMHAHLKTGLNERLQYLYGAKRCESLKPTFDKVALIPAVRKALDDGFLAPFRGGASKKREYFSAILFGPPGTAKTAIATAIAREVGWPLIELGVADFLSRGLDEVFSRSSEIFRDLLYVSNVVILLDEVEEVFRDRSGKDEKADLRQKFLTSALLPPLKRLRDEKNVILLIATNYIGAFDEAASRIGRIDLILPVGPPDLAQRTELIVDLLKHPRDRALELAKILPEGVTVGDIISLAKIDGHATLPPAEVLTQWRVQFPSGASVKEEQLKQFERETTKYSRLK